MATISRNTPTTIGTHERRAEAIRTQYGDNTIVWFSRQSHYALYGKDAEITAKIYNIALDYMLYNNEFVAYLVKTQYDWRTATAIAQGYKIVILQD